MERRIHGLCRESEKGGCRNKHQSDGTQGGQDQAGGGAGGKDAENRKRDGKYRKKRAAEDGVEGELAREVLSQEDEDEAERDENGAQAPEGEAAERGRSGKPVEVGGGHGVVEIGTSVFLMRSSEMGPK